MNENKPEISIIVPVYNVRPYIRACLDSILHQNYHNFELIIVDDGSTDGSIEEIEDLLADPRIILIKKTNGGLSSARNAGLCRIRGNYVCFIDSDDIVAPDFVRVLYTTICQSKADVVVCNFESFSHDKAPHINDLSPQTHSYKCPGDFWHSFTHDSLYCVAAWNKIYKKNLFADYRFPEGVVGEDLYCACSLLSGHTKITSVDARLYYYRVRRDSISNTHHGKDWLDIINGYILAATVFKNDFRSSDYKSVFSNTIEYYLSFTKRSCHTKKADAFWKKQCRSAIRKGAWSLKPIGLKIQIKVLFLTPYSWFWASRMRTKY